MKKLLTLFTFMWLLAFSFGAEAQSVADVKTQLISQMAKDGYIGSKTASEVAQKYVTQADSTVRVSGASVSNMVSSTASRWTQYLSWINGLKVAATLLFLFAFRGLIVILIRKNLELLKMIPLEFYQLVAITLTLVGTVKPEIYWASQAFPIVLFCSIANLILAGWFFATHEKLAKQLEHLFNIGIPVETILSFWGAVYFGALAVIHHSEIFGFLTAACISGVFSFGLFYTAGTLWLYFKENALAAMVFGHLLVLGVYAGLHITHTADSYLTYFNSGIQYYCTIALGVALLVGSSPFDMHRDKMGGAGFYGLLFVIMALLASVGYNFFDLKVMATIILLFFALFILEWVAYLGYQANVIIGSALLGGMLYGGALFMEHFGSLVVLHLN